MKVAQIFYRDGKFAPATGDNIAEDAPLLILGFGNKKVLQDDGIYPQLKARYTNANIILCSTSGEIHNIDVSDDSVSIVVISFETTRVETKMLKIKNAEESYDAGKQLFNDLDADDLAYLMVISDGGIVNGSQLVRGLNVDNEKKIPVTGGLAGDGDMFNYTVVGCNTQPVPGNIIAIGFYGTDLKIGHGSYGGWEIFGPEKYVTKSVYNQVYEIDNKSALELYKQYLGKYADELPRSALFFPLSVKLPDSPTPVVRTILSINAEDQSMIFAGDIPEGSYIRFMRANFDKIIDAATLAAANSLNEFPARESKPKLALLISCVGRRLILGSRTEEEVEAVKEIFGEDTPIAGFYSYGEISPPNVNSGCALHNQTMTITTFNEEAV